MAADPDPAGPDGADPGRSEEDESGPEVVGDDRTVDGFEELDHLVRVARSTLIGEGGTAGRLDLMTVDRDEMAALNVEHMGHSGPTDVLSFPLDADDLPPSGAGVGHGAEAIADRPPVHLGDIVVCPDVARVQAPDHCGTVEAELALLVVHGVLHVLGHDHAEPEERAQMVARERHHLAGLGHVHPDDRSTVDGAPGGRRPVDGAPGGRSGAGRAVPS